MVLSYSTVTRVGSLVLGTLGRTRTKPSTGFQLLLVSRLLTTLPFCRDIQTFHDWGFSYLKYDNCASMHSLHTYSSFLHLTTRIPSSIRFCHSRGDSRALSAYGRCDRKSRNQNSNTAFLPVPLRMGLGESVSKLSKNSATYFGPRIKFGFGERRKVKVGG